MEQELRHGSPTSGTTEEAFLTKKNSAGRAENPRTKVLSTQKSKLYSGFCSPERVIRDFNRFMKSGAPSRFLFFRNDTWVDLPREVFDVLRAGFVAGKTTLEVPINGGSYLFDFLHMTLINSSTGVQNFIAWIDDQGQCFFPRLVVEEQRNLPCSNLQIDLGVDEPFPPKRKRDSLYSAEEHSEENPEVSSAPNLDRPKWTGAGILSEEDRFYRIVEKLFLAGMRRLAPDTVVTSIHRCLHSGLSGISRLKAFQMLIQMMKADRGDANVKFGWYGAPATAIAAIIGHGFGRPDNGDMGFGAHGVGIHLSPPHLPHTSSLRSEPDEDGERHIVLCRIVMGNTERVEEGSHQYHPSGLEYDSGVDDPVNPKCYIVWSTHMNTHILPEYVVSFKSSNQLQGQRRAMGSVRRLSALGLSFSKLFGEMGRSLPSSRMQALESLYNQHKAGKMNKDTFIRYLRSIAGDKLLTSAIRRIRGH